MYVAINGTGNSKSIYIMSSYRKNNGKTSSRIFRKLGRLNDLLPQFDNNEEKLLEWARSEAKKDTLSHQQDTAPVLIPFSSDKKIKKNEVLLFIQSICSNLHFDNICRNIKNHHKFEYDIHRILCDLVYARVLYPSSKRSSFSFAHSLLEQPKYKLQDIYRSLSILAEESDYIQAEVYRNSNFLHKRNTKVLFEQEDELKKYGKSKEHRPNPIVGMGLFMDGDGFPLAFDIFPGNQNEQKSLKPLEHKVIQDFDCSEFIYCSDSGLASQNNKLFNDIGGRSYVIQYRKVGSSTFIDLKDLDENDPEVYESIYYKEVPIESKKISETLIVTYSPIDKTRADRQSKKHDK
ncbi:hypothetical protein [Amedibacterium intestinale]|uniref:IS1634 family transposase n=1 Tax=Amedibacterium intestinale TaxID=2583452 RepID=UPI0022E2D48B|nr:hypothetical protein [Amedibacterium intestinale]